MVQMFSFKQFAPARACGSRRALQPTRVQSFAQRCAKVPRFYWLCGAPASIVWSLMDKTTPTRTPPRLRRSTAPGLGGISHARTDRHRRPAQRRQVRAVQPHRRAAHRHRPRPAGRDARPHQRRGGMARTPFTLVDTGGIGLLRREKAERRHRQGGAGAGGAGHRGGQRHHPRRQRAGRRRAAGPRGRRTPAPQRQAGAGGRQQGGYQPRGDRAPSNSPRSASRRSSPSARFMAKASSR